METIHGQQLASLAGEVLQPLDLGRETELCTIRLSCDLFILFS